MGHEAWNLLGQTRPELGLRPGPWPFHNFLRLHREALVACDAIRKVRGRWWIAHTTRFPAAAFDCATGHGWARPVDLVMEAA
jgi:hypothetical protein